MMLRLEIVVQFLLFHQLNNEYVFNFYPVLRFCHCSEKTGSQFWIFIGRTVAEAPILWLPDAKSWLIGEDPEAGKDWRQEERGTTVDEMLGWHHWLNGHEFEQALGDGEGQGSLVCYSPWDCKVSDMTEWLNNNINRKTSVFWNLNLQVLRESLEVEVILAAKDHAQTAHFNWKITN